MGSIERGCSKGSHTLMLYFLLGRDLNVKVIWHGELTFVTVQIWSLRVLFRLFDLYACEHFRICDELRGVLTHVELSLKYFSSGTAARLHCSRPVDLQLIDAPIHIDVLHHFLEGCCASFVVLLA